MAGIPLRFLPVPMGEVQSRPRMAKRKKREEGKVTEQRVPKMGAAAKHRYDTFIEHYFATNGNGTAAAMLAGYSRKTARNIASELLTHPYISERVEARRRERLEKIHASADETLQIITRSARFDLRRLFNEDWSTKKPGELDDETALALDGVEIEYHTIPGEKGKRVQVLNVKYKGGKRMTAADMLARHHGLYAKDKELGDPDENAAAARQRLAEMDQVSNPKPKGGD